MSSSNYIRNVAIVGAGGQQGKHIVAQLLKTGKHKVTAITRQDSNSPIADGVELAKVNYDNHESLVAAMKGQDALIITMNVMAPPDQQSKLVKAAADAGVPWILPNEYGDNTDDEASKDILIGIAKGKLRREIGSLGKSSWIGIACGFWYEYSLPGGALRFGFDFDNKTVAFYGDGDVPIDVSTWEYVGVAVAKLLSLPVSAQHELCLDHYRNKFVHINAFTVNQRQMLDSVLRVTGDKENDWKITHLDAKKQHEEGHAMLKSGNRLGFVQLMYSRAFYPDDSGRHALRHGSDNEKMGLPKFDLDANTKLGLYLKAQGKLN
ncbi:hypothetical protein ANO11243_082610 [Dothideomycetidae sp. 11243]|nr:hypothetical protein ANO11243_082610 [fungal sp. No.11243]